MRVNRTYDEERVLELLIGGSEYAFTLVFDHYRPQVYRSALKFLKSPELAEEVVQEVFLKVWHRRKELSRVKNFKAYLFVICRNLIFDNFKKLAEEIVASREFAHDIAYESSTEEIILEKQYEELLNQAVDQLPPQQKKVFCLAKIDGLSYEDIAGQLNLSRFTVKTHMAKALQSIRHRLQHHVSSFIFLATVIRIFEN